MTRFKPTSIGLLGAFALLVGCADKDIDAVEQATRADIPAPKLRPKPARDGIDREMPQVFEVTNVAVWDGKPSMGNIWVEVPAAMQPERVRIRNAATGQVLTGAMLVAQIDADRVGPMKLSSQAAKALGLEAGESAQLTVTALRKHYREEAAPAALARMTRTAARRHAVEQPLVEDFELTGPSLTAEAPSIAPAPVEGDYVQVAEAIDPAKAVDIQRELAFADVPSEIQEDFVDGMSVYRVFANRFSDQGQLAGALDAIRFANEAEMGAGDGTLIAEMPNFETAQADATPAPWMEVGAYQSRNEAMAVVQRLSRRAVPAEVCEVARNNGSIYRVFGGPASDDAAVVGLDTVSFCAGVAATNFAPGFGEQVRLSTRPIDPLPQNDTPLVKAVIPPGAVRIRVGEATGDLSIKVPQPFSEPIKINIGDAVVTLPVNTPAEQVAEIARALLAVQNDASPADAVSATRYDAGLPFADEPLADTP